MGIGGWPVFGSSMPEPQAKTWVDGDTFHWEMVMPAQVKLLEDYGAMVHDEALKAAHAAGLLPVGEILVTEVMIDAPESAPLREGESLDAYMERRRQEAPFSSSPRMTVHAEVFLGARLTAEPQVVAPEEIITEAELDEELRRLLGNLDD